MQALLNRRQRLVAADQTGEPGGQCRTPDRVPGGSRGRPRRWRLCAGQHGQVGVPQFGGRVGAQFLGQCPPGTFEHLQRRRLLPVRMERAHQPDGGPLAQRVRDAEPGELGDQTRQRVGAAEREEGVGPLLHGRQPQLRQPGRRRRGEPDAFGVRERRPAPEFQRPAQQSDRLGEPTRRQRRPPRCHPLLEVPGVHAPPGQVEQVSGGVRADHGPVGPQRPAEPGNQGLQGAGRLLRRGVSPEVVHQTLTGDHAPGVESQPDQQQPKPRPADLEGRPALPPHDLKRPQNIDPHPARPSPSTSQHPRSLSRCPARPERQGTIRRKVSWPALRGSV